MLIVFGLAGLVAVSVVEDLISVLKYNMKPSYGRED